ncbi:Fis family transcriptional regulator [Oceanobacter mangrovi]|uniref:Fis family transcriptional regulator n=1 Tax=Oceanobacter mangrovi TaxID=2862510 RepID=UPI001FEAC9C4|nr:Fis family transcriptional regulator [Oceanobacter mangrovi]
MESHPFTDMKKADKKTYQNTDNAIIKALTNVCDIAQIESEGFKWLTHTVNYHQFPASLVVLCVYNTNLDLALADKDQIYALIKHHLDAIDIQLKDIPKHVRFDTEEACKASHSGKWAERLH